MLQNCRMSRCSEKETVNKKGKEMIMVKQTSRKRPIVEIEGEVVFSNIVKPYKRNENDESGLYSMTIRIRKDDNKQLKILADAAKSVLGLDKVTPTLMGLNDGAEITNSLGDPVDPDYYQLRVSGGRSDRSHKPAVVDEDGQPVDLTWEPSMSADGQRSVVALALSVSPWEHDVDNGLVKEKTKTASYFIRKVMLIDAHPYEDDYEFTRFGNHDNDSGNGADVSSASRFSEADGPIDDEEPQF